MSSSSEPAAASRRARVGLGLLAVGLAALGWFVPRTGSSGPGVPLPVVQGDLVLGVEVEGELEAVRSVVIGVPPVAETNFKIAYLVPEGTAVRKGTTVLGFDTEALSRLLLEKRAELAEATKRLDQKRIDLGLKRLDLEQRNAQGRADLAQAELKAEVPAEVMPLLELKAAALDRRGRQREIENLEAERRVLEANARSELASLGQQAERARGRVLALEQAIEAMSVRAPQDGLVVYQTNWNNEKKKVGDSVWYGEKILAIPDLGEMRGQGFVDEADGGGLKQGQRVSIRLEARPDLDVEGRISRIAASVRQRSWRTPGKGFRVEITFARSDPTFMRPAARFRGEIETDRVPALTLVPREAVFLRASGPVAWRRARFGWREVRLGLGRHNRTQLEVVSGLVAGDLVSPFDLAESPKPQRARRQAGS